MLAIWLHVVHQHYTSIRIHKGSTCIGLLAPQIQLCRQQWWQHHYVVSLILHSLCSLYWFRTSIGAQREAGQDRKVSQTCTNDQENGMGSFREGSTVVFPWYLQQEVCCKELDGSGSTVTKQYQKNALRFLTYVFYCWASSIYHTFLFGLSRQSTSLISDKEVKKCIEGLEGNKIWVYRKGQGE